MSRLMRMGLLLLLAGCSSVPDKPSPASLERIDQILGLTEIDSVALGGSDQTGLIPSLVGDFIAAASAGGDVYLFDANLKELWNVDLDRTIVAGVGSNKTAIYAITADARLTALSLIDGAKLFEISLPGSVTVAPVATDSLVFVKTQIGRLLALDPMSGRSVWIEEAQEANIGIRGGSPMTLSGGTLFVLWESGRLVAYLAESGRILWERQVALARGRSPLKRIVDSKGAPSIRNDFIATSTRNGQVSLLNSKSGQLLWSRDADAYPGVVLAFNAVTVVETDSKVTAFSSQSGELLWTTEALQYRELSPPSVVGGYIGVVDLEGKLHLLDPADGSIIGRLDLGSNKGRVAPVATKKGALIQLVNGDLSLVEFVH